MSDLVLAFKELVCLHVYIFLISAAGRQPGTATRLMTAMVCKIFLCFLCHVILGIRTGFKGGRLDKHQSSIVSLKV